MLEGVFIGQALPYVDWMFFGGFVRVHILYHAVKEPIFRAEMMTSLGVTVTTLERE